MPNVEGRKQVANESSLPNDDRWCSIMWFLIMNKTKPFDFINNRDYFFVSNFLILSGAFMLCNQNKSIHCNKQEKNFFLFFASIQFVLVWPSKYLNLCLLVFFLFFFCTANIKKKQHVRVSSLIYLVQIALVLFLLLCICMKVYTLFSRQ